ncbi:S8/S53 family peptidase [Tissierella praeacuta]|uniref:S8/S53 family peptidase n=1 Tax=Tissierella praeacuta TaxID=43131 RepID=UPI00333E4239
MIEAFKKTLKIGIIDSYFDADGLFLGDNIKIICERKQIYGIKDNNHTSRILNIIVSELKNISDINVEIYIFPILNDENKGINRDLYHAFNECIRNRVNIINLSLGTVRIYKDYVFDRLVEEAFNNDIYVVSAYSNTNAITYPACKKNVIGVKSLVGGYSYIYNNDDFIYANNDICFKYNYISVKNKYDIPLIGNSFLCAKVTGIISNQLIEKKFRFNSVSDELKKMASTNLNIDSLNRKIVLLYEIEENIKLIEIDSDKFIGILQLKKISSI